MQTDFTVPHSGISILNMDVNPYINDTMYCIIALLPQVNEATIKQLVQEYVTTSLQGVQTLWLAGITLSSEDHPLVPWLCALTNIHFVIHWTMAGFSLLLDQR